MPPEIRTFLEGILQDANMTSPDDETREEMLKELFARFDNYMTSSIVENLKEEDMEEFIKMGTEQKPKEEIEKFISEKIPNAQEVFSQAMMDFRETYIGGVVEARNASEDTQTVQEPGGQDSQTQN